MRISDWSSDVCSSDLAAAKAKEDARAAKEAERARIAAEREGKNSPWNRPATPATRPASSAVGRQVAPQVSKAVLGSSRRVGASIVLGILGGLFLGPLANTVTDIRPGPPPPARRPI